MGTGRRRPHSRHTPQLAFAGAAAGLLWLATAPLHAAGSYSDHGAYGDRSQSFNGLPVSADYVIIGGGTAGSAVAARLCEALPESSVVVLERAAPRTPELDLLVASSRLVFDARFDPGLTESWLSEPNNAVLPPGKKLDVLTGFTLGGTSSINAAQWTKPPLSQVVTWGFTGLTADMAEELYSRAEAQLGVAVPREEIQSTYHPQYAAAAAAAGLPPVSDPLSLTETVTGYWYVPLAVTDQGVQIDSATGYLMPALEGPCSHNLRLIESATVTQILVEGGRAVGVEYELEGEEGSPRVVAAVREVVCSAGPFMSPKLLQLSGIGAAEVLEPLGVEVKVDLPVGQAAQGRGQFAVADIYTAVPLAPENNSSRITSDAARARFLSGGGGPLGFPVGSGVGTIRGVEAYLLSLWTLNVEVADIPIKLSAYVMYSQSRGSVLLNSTDPRAPPRVALNLLGDPHDAADMLKCALDLNAINRGLDGVLGLQTTPPPTEQAVRETADNALHFVGGCRVLQVVDGEFRVRGVEGLRVVDASVLPELPRNAGPMASVYMLAEHAAAGMIAAASA
eukprot:jgi/Ulvmu1/10463/UM063_0020.1